MPARLEPMEKRLNMRLPPGRLELYAEQARAEHLTLSAWIRRTLEAALPRSFAQNVAQPAPGRRLSAAARAARYAQRQRSK